MSRFARRCRHPSCTELTRDASGYCGTHAVAARRAYEATYARRAAKSFYTTAAWRKLRKQILAARPKCESCGRAKATHADHKRSMAAGGAALDPANVQALCRSCHSRKTAAVDGGFGNRRKG